jgi:translation elongation factor EF-G
VLWQTHAVLRQAWTERMKPCLVLNKVRLMALTSELSTVICAGFLSLTHWVNHDIWSSSKSPTPCSCTQVDRLITELRLTPMEAYWHLQRVLERTNAICSSLITNETFRLEETETYADELEKVGHVVWTECVS